MEWTALGKISTGLALVAFIAALIVAAYRASVKGRIDTLKALPPKDRLASVTQALNTFGINSANLTQENAYNLALQELAIKDRRYKLIAGLVVVLAVIFAIVSIYAIYGANPKGVSSSGVSTDALVAMVAASTKDWRSMVEKNQKTISALERQHDLTEVQLRALLIQVGLDPGAATGDELNAKLVALVRELQEGKRVLQKVDIATAGAVDPQVKALRAQAKEAVEQGNLPALNKSLASLIWRWPPGSPKDIPVCWEADAEAFDQERLVVQDAIARTWQALGIVRFVGWDTCSNDQRGIRIGVADETPHTRLGNDLDGLARGMILNFKFQQWGSDCLTSPERKALCIKVTAVHEFGHALGLTHEHEKPDAPPECRQTVGRQGNETQIIAPYDAKSVMNYCSPVWLNDGVLSAGDRLAISILYGPDSATAATGALSPQSGGGPSPAAAPPKP